MESIHDYLMSSTGRRKTIVRINLDDDDDMDEETPPTQRLKSRRRTSSHESDLFVRYQEISEDSWSNRYHYVLFCSLLGNGSDVFPTTMALAMTLSGGKYHLQDLPDFIVGLCLFQEPSWSYWSLTRC